MDLDPIELGEVFAGYGWRSNRAAITTAWYTAAFTMGTEGLTPLAELLSDEPTQVAEEDMVAEFHRRMKKFGWE